MNQDRMMSEEKRATSQLELVVNRVQHQVATDELVVGASEGRNRGFGIAERE